MIRPNEPAPYTVSIDPGGCYAAVAAFKGKKLIHASKWEVEQTRNLGMRGLILSMYIVNAVSRIIPAGSYVHVLCEGQQFRKQGNAKGDQQPQIELALNSGFILSAFYQQYNSSVLEYVPPTSWKGTIDKEIKLRQIKRELAEEEKKAMTHKNEHTFDAAGIGLWWLKRMR